MSKTAQLLIILTSGTFRPVGLCLNCLQDVLLVSMITSCVVRQFAIGIRVNGVHNKLLHHADNGPLLKGAQIKGMHVQLRIKFGGL